MFQEQPQAMRTTIFLSFIVTARVRFASANFIIISSSEPYFFAGGAAGRGRGQRQGQGAAEGGGRAAAERPGGAPPEGRREADGGGGRRTSPAVLRTPNGPHFSNAVLCGNPQCKRAKFCVYQGKWTSEAEATLMGRITKVLKSFFFGFLFKFFLFENNKNKNNNHNTIWALSSIIATPDFFWIVIIW